MKQYELIYILPATMAEDEVPKAAQKISGLLQSHNAHITQEIDLGKKRLAYPIAHQHYGYYRIVEFATDPERLGKMNDVLRLSTDVVRHQVVLKPEKSPATIEREQALRARLAARRAQQRTTETVGPTLATEVPAVTLTPEELEKKIEKILAENPDV